MLFEITKRRINFSKHEETALTQYNSLIALCVDKQLLIIDFSYNLQCLEKYLDFVERTIPCPVNNASSKYVNNYVTNGVPNEELVNITTDQYMWPYSSHLLKETINIASFQFSPYSFVSNNSVLAVLNNVGHVEIYTLINKEWCSLINLSSHIKTYFNIMHGYNKKPESMEELKDVVYRISTSSMCWSPYRNTDGSCYFVTAQNSGLLVMWHLKYDETISNFSVIDILNVDIMQINCVNWIPSNELFLLVYASLSGELYGKLCKINNKTLICTAHINLWTHKDRMSINSIVYTNIGNKLVIVFSKHRHVVAQLYDTQFKLLSQNIAIINDNHISCITKAKNGIYVATINVKIYKANFIITDDQISVTYEQIPTKDPYTNYNLHGLTFSNNNVICCMALIDRKVLYRKVQMKLELSFFCFEEDYNSDELNKLLMNNSSKKLTHMWDCIEILRYKTLKRKRLPSIDFHMLYNEAETDIYKLKIYLILLTLYDSLESILNNNSKGLLPETSQEVVKEKILYQHASNYVNEIHEKYKKYNSITSFESECLSRCVKYMEFYNQKYKKDKSDVIDGDIIKLCSEYNYICQFCDCAISEFVGECGHLNMFCSLTFRLIVDMDHLVCKCCKAAAMADLFQNKPLCVFCDLYLENN
ncbi:unnamed protein product [Leptidea sinapis]|uniref:Uncharacterized protein n=1 Tax=Leptidea sinapis TaxID=189913 RepID=A0A5E4QCR1_9NEOP|nr:unnamed protein product [Leptidea sinapis]